MPINEPLAGAYPARLPFDASPFPLAKGGLVIGLIGLIVAILFWTGVVGGGAKAVNTSSPSYISGSNYGAANFSVSTTQGAVCNASNAGKTDKPTQWMQGCHDAWAIANFSSNYPNRGGGFFP